MRLRADVRAQVGLPITVGVARTKFLAKVASGVGKPDGLLVVPVDGELDFPAPAAGAAAVGRRPGRPPTSCTRAGITTVADVADLDERALVSMLGPAAGTPPARAGAQPRPAPGARRATAPLDRIAERARSPSADPG